MLTGFSLFTRETQNTQRVLKATSLKAGAKENMRVVAKLWHGLSRNAKRKWNERAAAARKRGYHDEEKKNNAFNLVMRVFAQSDGVLLNAGNEKFTAMLAKRTCAALSPAQVNAVRQHFHIDTSAPALRRTPRNAGAHRKRLCSHFRMVNPDMRLFSSFTEMQRAVAPTREAGFISVSQVVGKFSVSAAGQRSLRERFRTLKPERLDEFSPISDEEAPAFEAFCASKCVLLDPHRFSILSLFAEFRGIAAMREKPSSTQVSIYRSLAAMDRVRDSLYHKVYRILLCVKACRSSDCSVYIASTTPTDLSIPPTAYAVDGGTLSDVDVARMLAETRTGQSVYDDLLNRASVLRPHDRQKLLEVYDVRSTAAQQDPVQLVSMRSQRSDRVALARAKRAGTRTAASRKTVTAATTTKVVRRARTKVSARPMRTQPTIPSHSPLAPFKKRAEGSPQKPRSPRKASTRLSAAVKVKSSRAQKKKDTRGTSLASTAVPVVSTPTVKTAMTAAAEPARDAAKKGRPNAPAAVSPVKEDGLFTAEERMLSEEEDDGLADYDAFEADETMEAVASPAEPKAKRLSSKVMRSRSVKHRVRSVASMLKGSKQPILVTSHIAPKKKVRATIPTSSSAAAAAAAAPGSDNSATVTLLRKQLAGFL